ncbi:molybdopterin molybdotransferase MoeA [Rothia nasimurium]|uniref:molybdopterin molybdotransferase MoeA n=1 Tax=Rothia nasimurium TaxID=85336 RepID=UPI001F37F87D|nr:molybdopterin molybdotransferase MoeA [Rothia nasimurium]
MHHTSWQQARQLLHQAGATLARSDEEVPLAQEAIGRTLSKDARALLPVPHYDSSAMDGYATAGAPPWQLLTHPPAAEGENIHQRVLPLTPGQATPVLTGGLIPPGTDAVLRQEHALVDGNTLRPDPKVFGQGYPALGADIRRAGEELSANSTVLPAGTLITARHLGALATLGLDTLTVTARPTVAIAYTGNEIITSGLPGPGQVRDAYSMAFPHIIENLGASVSSVRRLPDSKTQLTHWLTTTGADLLLITGGSSTSTADWVRRALADLDASYLFESVAIRPGHPALAARLPASNNPTSPLVLGLPGNPLAAYTALYSYLPPWLTGATGAPLAELAEGILTHPIPGYRKHDLRLLPATLTPTPEGRKLTPLPKTQSHMLTSFATADALALIPPDGAAAGQAVSYLPLPS